MSGTPKLARSRSLPLPDGRVRRFSTLGDFVSFFQELGEITTQHDLTSREDLLRETAFEWLRQGQSGCQFAIHMSMAPTDYRLMFAAIPGSLSEVKMDLLELLLRDATKAGQDAVVLGFPDVTTDADIRGLVNTLTRHTRWYSTVIEPKDASYTGDLIGLRWVLPSDECVNWVLGFASTSRMPLTRQSPFTMMVLRVQDRRPDTGPGACIGNAKDTFEADGRAAVHLAEITDSFMPPEKCARTWRQTQKNKQSLLAEAPEAANTARGRVTFSLEPVPSE